MTAVVFSAHAEVVPDDKIIYHWDNSILRARGGSSIIIDRQVEIAKYSPRTRR